MRFLSQTHRSAAAAVALALLAATAQAQGLRVPGQPKAAAPQAGDPAVSRALDATNLSSARERGGNAGVRSADYIVAVVNSEPVTNNEVRARMARVAQNIAEQGGQMPPEALLAREVLERLIVEKAQLQEAKDTGLRVDDYAVDQALGNVARQNGLDKAGLLSRLRAEGVDEKQFREELRRQITLQRLRERDVDGRVRVTDADIDRYLAEQRNGGADKAPAAVNLGHILIAVNEGASPGGGAARAPRAKQAAEAARTQGDFKAVVKEFSDVPDGQGGGAMGMRPLDRYPELFAKAVGQAPLGGIVGPFRSGAGFHVLKVLEKSQAGMPSVVTQNHARHIRRRPGLGLARPVRARVRAGAERAAARPGQRSAGLSLRCPPDPAHRAPPGGTDATRAARHGAQRGARAQAGDRLPDLGAGTARPGLRRVPRASAISIPVQRWLRQSTMEGGAMAHRLAFFHETHSTQTLRPEFPDR
jgi:peptidyl-prolyl cis-trans isomerase SurA